MHMDEPETGTIALETSMAASRMMPPTIQRSKDDDSISDSEFKTRETPIIMSTRKEVTRVLSRSLDKTVSYDQPTIINTNDTEEMTR